MRLYLAATEPSHTALAPLAEQYDVGYLVSYYSLVNNNRASTDVVKTAQRFSIPLFLDSGAFSAMTQGAKIDLSAYIDFCLEHADTFDLIASLDVIGDWRSTLANHRSMIEAGVESIPTFHVNEPWSALRDLLTTNSYIALGVAGQQKKRRQVMAWITRCFKLRQEIAPDCLFHGFGLTSSVVLCFFPWTSVDSTTWQVGRRFGDLIVVKGRSFSRVHRSLHAGKAYGDVPELPRSTSNENYHPTDYYNAEQLCKLLAGRGQ